MSEALTSLRTPESFNKIGATKLPAGATGFTTIELKSNHMGTALGGTIVAVATPLHCGKTTQVWDAVVTHKESARTLAVFRCTQMILYPKPKAASEPASARSTTPIISARS